MHNTQGPRTPVHKRELDPPELGAHETTSLLINEDVVSEIALPLEIITLLETFTRYLQSTLSVEDQEHDTALRQHYESLMQKIKQAQPGLLSTRYENILTTVLAYFAAIKGSIGAAALIELSTHYIAAAFNTDMDNPDVWAPMLAAEVTIGIVALSLNLPFYFKNVRDGLLALNLATPATIEEVLLREKIEKMSWIRYFSSLGLAFGAGLGQGGMATLNTFFLKFLQSFTSKYVPNQASQWLLGAPVFLSNFVIYFPKSDKALDIFQTLADRSTPKYKRILQALEYICAMLAVVPNVLGAGAIFSQQMQSLDPLYQKLIISFSGVLMSIGPIGLNVDELEKLLQAKEGFYEQIKKNYGGYIAAAASASFSCIFTYKLVTQVFGGVQKSDSSDITTSNIGVEVAAISLTLFNTLFLILTKGRPFADHYRGTSSCKEFLAKLFGGCYPSTAEVRWENLIQALITLSHNPQDQDCKTDFVNAFQVFIRMIPSVHYAKDSVIRAKIRHVAQDFADNISSIDPANSHRPDERSKLILPNIFIGSCSEPDISSEDEGIVIPAESEDDLTPRNEASEGNGIAGVFLGLNHTKPARLKKATCYLM